MWTPTANRFWPKDGGIEQQLAMEGEFEAGRPPGLKPGTSLDVMLAVNFPPQAIPAGGQYVWQLTIDGQTDEDWRLGFTTRPEAIAEVA